MASNPNAVEQEILQAVNSAQTTDKRKAHEQSLAYLPVEEERGVNVVGSKMKPRYIALTCDDVTRIFYIHRLKVNDKGGMTVVKSWPLFELQNITVINDHDVTMTINKPHLLRTQDTSARDRFVFSVAKNYMYYMGRPLSVTTTDGRKVDWAYRNSFADNKPNLYPAKSLAIPKARSSLPENSSEQVSSSFNSRVAHNRNFSDGPIVTNLETDQPRIEKKLTIDSSRSAKKKLSVEKERRFSDNKPSSNVSRGTPSSAHSDVIEISSSSAIARTSGDRKDDVLFDTSTQRRDNQTREMFIQEQAQLFPSKPSLRKTTRREQAPSFNSGTSSSERGKNSISGSYEKNTALALEAGKYNMSQKDVKLSSSLESNAFASDFSKVDRDATQAALSSSLETPSVLTSSYKPSSSSKVSAKSVSRKPTGAPAIPKLPPKHPSRQPTVRATPSTGKQIEPPNDEPSIGNELLPLFESLRFENRKTTSKPKAKKTLVTSIPTKPHQASVEKVYDLNSKINLKNIPEQSISRLSTLKWNEGTTIKDVLKQTEFSFDGAIISSVENLAEEEIELQNIKSQLQDCALGCESINSTINLFSLELSTALNGVINIEQQPSRR